MNKFLLFIIVLFSLISCKTRKVVENKPINTQAAISNNKIFFEKILKNDDFETLKINSKIDAELGQSVPTIDAVFYIENHQKIWANMAVIFNVARGIATPTGVKAYEKINKTYIDSDFTYINKLLNVNFIDYHALQNLLLGKTFLPINEKDFTLTKNAQGFILESSKNQTITINGKTSEYQIKLQYSTELDLNNVMLQELKSNNSLEVQYAGYTKFNSQKLPKNVKIFIKGQKNGQILIENTNFEDSKMETPFTIPNNYTKTEIR